MRGNQKKMLVVFATLAVLWGTATQAHETETSGATRDAKVAMQKLRWKNGDILPGQLLESTSETIRWASPYFSEDLVVDSSALESVIFPKQSVPATEAFRVVTVSGDIWMADIVGSDENTFLFSSKRHGQFRVNRTAIYTLESQVHPNLIFDGSQLTAWKSSERRTNDLMFLVGGTARSDWSADRSGHPYTNQVKSKIFHALNWPRRFEIALELAATSRPPGFVFALGKNLYKAVRLETWVNELVVVQGTLFELVLTIQPDRRSFHLRLAYDGGTGVLNILDRTGNVLLELKDVRPTVEEAGLYVYNRGQDLTIRRLRVYRQPTQPANQRIDSSKPRVHKMDGQVVPGILFVEKNSSYVLDTDGTRHALDLQQIDRVVQPGTALIGTDQAVGLTYPDGAVLHGKIVQVNRESVLLQTGFADEPVTCSFAGASLLRLKLESPPVTGAGQAEPHGRAEDKDKLFHPSGSLRGRVLFDGKGASCIQWQPVGALKAVRLVPNSITRIERAWRRASKIWPFDPKQYPHVLHLKNGENVACQISSYNGTTLNFQSPFLSVQRIDSARIKALEFSGRTYTPIGNRTLSKSAMHPIRIFENGERIQKIEIQNIQIVEDGEKDKFVFRGDGNLPKNGEIILFVDGDGKRLKLNPNENWVEIIDGRPKSKRSQLDVKLQCALTVPRFSRENPPTHLVVVNTGDMKRGKLLGFDGQTIQFDSKLRQFSIPLDRVARVVDVSKGSEPPPDDAPDVKEQVLVKLTDGSILIFEPLESKTGKLLGRSPLYGVVEIPVNGIQHLRFGDAAASLKTAFAKWVVRPAKEPTFVDEP